MSEHHNQYHRQRHPQQHPYNPVGGPPHHAHPPPQPQHPQHYPPPPQQQQQQQHYPPPPPPQHRHHIPHSNSSSASVTEDSRGSTSNSGGGGNTRGGSKRSAAGSSEATGGGGGSSPAAVADAPESPDSVPRPPKKAKKTTPSPRSSTPRSSPGSSGDSGSVRSGGTTAGAARGLRHFSMMVCQKVEEKGTTSYNEVADELVKKVMSERNQEDRTFDQKNIRRRVYDALNVLKAMDIISNEKKEITWKGLPTAAKQNMDSMTKEIEYRQNQIAQKKEALKDLLTQQVCFRNLVQRNHDREPLPPPALGSSAKSRMPEETIPLPFIVVNTNQSAVIQCDMSGDRTNVMFDFSLPFAIKDDNTILKKLQM